MNQNSILINLLYYVSFENFLDIADENVRKKLTWNNSLYLANFPSIMV